MKRISKALWERLHGRRKVPFLIYNCKVNRDAEHVARFVAQVMRTYGLKVALLQEAVGYQSALNALPGFTNYQSSRFPESSNVAILVRDGKLAQSLAFVKHFKSRWWGAKNNRWRNPRSTIAVRAYGILWICLHRLAYQEAKGGVNLKGNREIDDWIIEEYKDYTGRVLIGGDINDVETSEEVQRIKRKTAMMSDSLGGIDFVIYKGALDVDMISKLEETGGSDHHPKIGVATRRRRTLISRRRKNRTKAA